jgi:N-acetylglutamate synthase-like GNAT family acetyltransferase
MEQVFSGIRTATVDDIPWIIEELKDFSKFIECGASKFPSEEYAVTTLKGIIENHVFLIACENNLRVGFIGGITHKNLMNPDATILAEMMWWVTPGKRHTGVGQALLQSFINVGRVLTGVSYVTVSLENNSPIRDNILTGLGLRPAERTFVMEV